MGVNWNSHDQRNAALTSDRIYLGAPKRCLDLAIAAPLFVLTAPLIGLISLLVRWQLGSPVFFRQERAGYRGAIFAIYKFRTMLNTRDAQGQLLPDEQRLTWLGRWLRQLSLDELPQLWNVLRGDMSLVGPRPLLVRYLPRYSPTQARRHEVPPGITGWAQVNGRNALSWEEKFELDVWYVDHASFALDLQILFRTFTRVLARRDVSSAGHATMPEFMGSRDYPERAG